jgi:hypothetical protein
MGQEARPPTSARGSPGSDPGNPFHAIPFSFPVPDELEPADDPWFGEDAKLAFRSREPGWADFHFPRIEILSAPEVEAIDEQWVRNQYAGVLTNPDTTSAEVFEEQIGGRRGYLARATRAPIRVKLLRALFARRRTVTPHLFMEAFAAAGCGWGICFVADELTSDAAEDLRKRTVASLVFAGEDPSRR